MVGDRPGIELLRPLTWGLLGTLKTGTYPGVSTNTLTEIRSVRLGKAAALRNLGLNPYPSRSRRTHYAKAILDDFPGHDGKSVTVAGRLMSWRKQGALAFGHVQDQTGRIQLFLRRQLVQPTAAMKSTQEPPAQYILDGHALPQRPQFALSVASCASV